MDLTVYVATHFVVRPGGFFLSGRTGELRCSNPALTLRKKIPRQTRNANVQLPADPPPRPAWFLMKKGQPVSHEYGDPLGQIKDGVETG